MVAIIKANRVTRCSIHFSNKLVFFSFNVLNFIFQNLLMPLKHRLAMKFISERCSVSKILDFSLGVEQSYRSTVCRRFNHKFDITRFNESTVHSYECSNVKCIRFNQTFVRTLIALTVPLF